MAKSIKRRFLSFFNLLILSILVCVLIGCGNSESTGTDDGTDTDTEKGSLVLSLSSGAVTFGTPVTATATLRDKDGVAISGAVVSFLSTNSLVVFTPTSATALTNGSGVASITLNASSIDAAGATSITASATFTSESTTEIVTSTPVGIAVNGATLSLGTVSLGASSISAYGTSSVSVPVYLGASLTTVPISVTFTSPCVTAGKATLSSPVTTVAGVATSTYKDNGCGTGSDAITASVTGDTANATITVAAPAANNIQFVSATPSVIGTSTAGAASLPTSSLVKFKVVDSSNNGISGVTVDFTLIPDSAPGGITLSATQATSDANGEISTSLSSGTIPTPVWVVATIHSTSLKSQSNTLTITTGLPTQDFLSLSVQTYNLEGWSYDNETSTLTIIASDRLGNPVPNGTVINFITEGAHIDNVAADGYAFCETQGGVCSVTFRSAEFRPADGRITILAYAIGEKSFADTDRDNSYDAGETFYDIGDPYIDANENGLWDAGEFSIASTTSGSSACLTRPGATALPGSYANAPSKENSCTAAWGQNYVRRSAVIVLSGSDPTIFPTSVTMGSVCLNSFDLLLYDLNNNPMPAGTSITTGSNYIYYIPNGATAVSKPTVSITSGYPVENTNNYGGTTFRLTVEADCSAGVPVAYPSGYVYVDITTPKGKITGIPITVN